MIIATGETRGKAPTHAPASCRDATNQIVERNAGLRTGCRGGVHARTLESFEANERLGE
jgi:hypothetical protein